MFLLFDLLLVGTWLVFAVCVICVAVVVVVWGWLFGDLVCLCSFACGDFGLLWYVSLGICGCFACVVISFVWVVVAAFCWCLGFGWAFGFWLNCAGDCRVVWGFVVPCLVLGSF